MINKNKLNFVIHALDYSDKSGGVIACHMLAEILYIFSQNVFIYKGKTYPNCPVNIIPEKENLWKFLDKKNTVVVYPELINTNPLGAEHIARWLLNSPGKLTQSKKYTPYGEHFLYSNQFIPVRGEKNLPILFAYNPKLSIFKNNNINKRSGTVYMIRKGKEISTKYKINKNWKERPDFDASNHDIEILNLFNKIENFISFDDTTVYSIIAALCGANSIVIPKENVTKEQWRSSSPLWKYGIAYGLDDIAYCRETSSILRKHLEELKVFSYKTIIDFINFWYVRILGEPLYKFDVEEPSFQPFLIGIAKSHSPDLINFLSKGLESQSFCNLEQKLKENRDEIDVLKMRILKLNDSLLIHIPIKKLLVILIKRIKFRTIKFLKEIL